MQNGKEKMLPRPFTMSSRGGTTATISKKIPVIDEDYT